MDITNLITIVTLILNFIALCVVAHQTSLNRRAVLLAKESIDENRKTRQMEMLPRAGFVFEAQYHLNKWRTQLDALHEEIEKASSIKDDEEVKLISEKAIMTSKGLISKSFYHNAPKWMVEILVAGAQYYYNSQVLMRDIWYRKDQEPNWDLIPDVIYRLTESSKQISQLLKYIDQVIPDAYAKSPAILSDFEFLSDD